MDVTIVKEEEVKHKHYETFMFKLILVFYFHGHDFPPSIVQTIAYRLYNLAYCPYI